MQNPRLPLIASLLLAALHPLALAQQAVRFVDVTTQGGITFTHHSAPEKKYLVESMSGGVVLFDYDKDGWLDIYLVNSLTVDSISEPDKYPSHLYRNNHDGTFSERGKEAGVSAPGWGMGGCVGDYDGDGWLDLYVTCFGPNRLYRNNGQGGFEEVAARLGVDDHRYSAGCGFADYDRDGDLDLFVANYVDFKLDDLPQFGKGKLCQYKGIPVQCGPRGLPGAGDGLYRQESDGKFMDVSKQAGVHDPEGYYGMGVIWTDADQDGWIDLFVANDSRPNFFYRNRQDGTFEDMGFLSGTAVGEDGSEQGSMGAAVGDYNRDGRLDLYVTNFSEEYNAVYRLDKGDFLYTDLSFASRTAESSFPYVGWGTGFIDYDNDGWLDILAVNGHVYPQVDQSPLATSYAQRKLFYRNNRDGSFSEIAGQLGTPLQEKRASRGAAFGDIDNDGDVDVMINDLDGSPMLLRNDGGNAKNWLRVRLEGKGKNRFALGALVRVVSGDVQQSSEVRSGDSYISQSDLRLHFGLGESKKADRIEVRWPDGSSSSQEGVPANQEVVIRQK